MSFFTAVVLLCLCAIATVHGGFSAWAEWSACDVTCGGSSHERHRTCENKAHDPPCHGALAETLPCGTSVCPVLSQCDKLCTIGLIAEMSSAESIVGTVCGDGTYASADALVGKCCQHLTPWTQGAKIKDSCSCTSHTLYTALGRFEHHFINNTAGVFVGCLDDGSGFMMARQRCGSAPTIDHITVANGTEFLNSFHILMVPPSALTT